MKDLKYFQDKIKEKRKQTPFLKFLIEVPSWCISNFYKNAGFISRYPETNRSPKLVSTKEFYNIRDNMLDYGNYYDFNKNLFENFDTLYKIVPVSPTIQHMIGENTEFSDTIVASNNCYLSNIVVGDCNNVFYSFQVVGKCEYVFNSIRVFNGSQIVYFSFMIYESFKIFYSKSIIGSNNIRFSVNLRGCSECIFCSDLENKSYCINNKELSKEEYFIEKEKILKNKTKFLEYYINLEDKGKNIGSHNVSGKFIVRSENMENCFGVQDSMNSRNSVFCGQSQDFYDTFDCGFESKDFYGVCGSGTYSNNIFCCTQVENCYNMYYCNYCNNSNNCIACIGLSNKSYCILNKQYSKEEWEITVIKIFSHMEEDGTLGDFFPGYLNPFYFNDTIAYFLGDFNKKEVEKEGYMWREGEIKVDIPEGAEVVYIGSSVIANKVKQSSSLDNYESNHSRDDKKYLNDFQGYIDSGSSQEGQKWYINPEILKKVIKDEKGNYYRIVKMEYDFLMKHGLPLPEIHRLDRIKLGFKFN